MKKEYHTGYLNIDSVLYSTRLNQKFLERKKFSPADYKVIRSYIPGTISEILVTEGQEVCVGEEVIILEAMKMKNRIQSASNGRIKAISVKEGDKVAKGSLLVELE